MFDGIVDQYDLLNRLISLGMDGRWRRATMDAVRLGLGTTVLDLGCGTGDLSLLAAQKAQTVGVDLSAEMLKRAGQRLQGAATLVRASAFELPFRDGTFSAAVSGFVLRNLYD